MKILEETTRFEDGKYKVGLLWKDQERPSIPSNLPMVLNSFHTLEKGFYQKPEFAAKYASQVGGVTVDQSGRIIYHISPLLIQGQEQAGEDSSRHGRRT